VRSLIAFALVLAACRGSDRSDLPASHSSSPPTQRGPDALVLRSPRNGGVARVTAYPNVDSTVWTATDAAPPLDHVLAFDADAGLIAAVDTRGFPLWLDLRVGSVTIPNRGKLRGLVSVDGTTIYGVGADGAVVRFTPSGNGVFKTPLPAIAVFPQLNGTLLVLGGRGEAARVWRMHPPETKVLDSLLLPNVTSGTGAPLGDRVYFLSGGRTLTGVHARTLAKGQPIEFDHLIRAVASTPSGDRLYVLTDSSETVSVIDRYQDRVTARIEMPGRPRDLRVDPFGRYVLVRAAAGDSVWIVGIGANQVVGTVRSAWRSDVPFVAADGAVAVLDGADVSFSGAGSPREIRRVAGGASDFWYPFVWIGLRPRAASLDQPPPAPKDTDTSPRVAPPPAADTVVHARPAPSPDSAKLGFTVSFAALLNETKAREQAAKINVNGEAARVVTNVTDGTAVYRVVLGPYPTRDEADRVGKASGQTYYVYAGSP
jgi:YVTN family beta-propeller protein